MSATDPVHPSSKRKQNTREEGDDTSDDGDGTGKDVATSKELKLFAEAGHQGHYAKGPVSHYTSIDACVPEDVPGKEALVVQIDKDAKSLGILRHLVSVCLNVLAEKDPSNPFLVSRMFIQQLFTRLSGNEFNTKTNVLHHPHLEVFLQEHRMDQDTLREVRSFPLRCRDALCGEMITAIKARISTNLESRVVDHLSCELKRRLWESREDTHFWTNIPRAATELYKAAGQKSSQQASADLRVFIERRRGEEKQQLPPEWGVPYAFQKTPNSRPT